MLSQARWSWPVLLVPFAKANSRTRSFTGKAVLKHIKRSLRRAVVELTESGLAVRGRLLNTLHLVVPIGQINAVRRLDGNPGAVEVTFENATRSRFARFIGSGAPLGTTDRVTLIVDHPEAWIETMTDLIARHDG